MTTEEALKVLIQVAVIAQAKGALSLDDAVIVKQAIDLFKEPTTVPNESLSSKVEDAEVVV